MLVDISITGQVEIDDGDIAQLSKDSITTLAVVLQQYGKNVKTRVAEVYEKEQAKEAK